MNRSVLFHRENEYEWRYVGIWADTVDFYNIKALLLNNIKEENFYKYLILFRKYQNVISILNKNLIRRNFCHHIQCSDKFSKNQKKIILVKENKKILKSIEYLKYKDQFQVLNVETGELTIFKSK